MPTLRGNLSKNVFLYVFTIHQPPPNFSLCFSLHGINRSGKPLPRQQCTQAFAGNRQQSQGRLNKYPGPRGSALQAEGLLFTQGTPQRTRNRGGGYFWVVVDMPGNNSHPPKRRQLFVHTKSSVGSPAESDFGPCKLFSC